MARAFKNPEDFGDAKMLLRTLKYYGEDKKQRRKDMAEIEKHLKGNYPSSEKARGSRLEGMNPKDLPDIKFMEKHLFK